MKDLKLVKMHVKSLHVRIPHNEAITCIKKKYDSYSTFKQSTSLPYAKISFPKERLHYWKDQSPSVW